MKNATEGIIVLDRSGSMQPIKDDIIGGFNDYINEQKKLDGEFNVTLVEFSDEIKTVYDRTSIEKVKSLTDKSYSTGGMTRLYDAIGKTMFEAGKKLDALKEEDKPDKVLMIIITDGHENDSREYTCKMIKDSIEEQKTKYNWKFVYLGVGEECITDQKDLGFSRVDSYVYHNVADTVGSKGYFNTAYVTTSNLRSRGIVGNVADLVESE